MREKFDKLITRYGYKELFFIVFYPLFLPFFMLRDTTLSVYNIIKELLKYDWKYLSGNDQKNAYNNFFYYIQDYNIQKFGRYGRSNLLAGGDYSLKNWFHTTPFSLRLQSSFGTTFIMFFAMCFWMLSLVILYQNNPNLWILSIVFFSTLFFATFIEIQNYNILGWMLYPIFFTYIESANYVVLTTVLFLIALSSFTAFFIAGILIVISSVYLANYYLPIVLVPGGVKWILPIFISMKDGALSKVLGTIGGHEKVKYTRANHKKINIQKFYILGLQIQFVLFSFILQEIDLYNVLLFFIVGLFMVNELFLRFADQQSFYLLYITIGIVYLLNVSDSFFLTLSFIVSIFPVYGLIINVLPRGGSFISPAVRKPYNSRETILQISKLFSVVPKESKLLVAYKNPEKKYDNLFNAGYRIFHEPMQYAANINDICLLPDWYSVIDNNKENNDEDFWINDEEDAMSYMMKNSIEYILVPSGNNFTNKKFMIIGQLNFELNTKYFSYKNYSVILYRLMVSI